MRQNQKGFGVIVALLTVLLVGAVGLMVWFVYNARQQPLNSPTETKSSATEQCNNDSNLSILSGAVTEGPIRPGPVRQGEQSSRPVGNHAIEARDSNAQVIATTKTDNDGKYVLCLKPGHYALVLSPKVGLGTIKGNEVEVTKGSNRNFDISLDTGLR